MKNIIDEIQREINKKKIDWNRLEEYVGNLGERINLYNEKDKVTILSELYSSHSKPGYVNERLTDLFIRHGFNVNANEGKNGASCLCALCWSSYDKYILPIAEKLLDNGADSTISCDEDWNEESDEKGVLKSISWEFGNWVTGEYDSANMFEAYYEMIDRHQKGKKYQGIRAFREAVGEVVTKVEKLELLTHTGEVRTAYLISCGKHQLIANDYVEFIINPYVRDEAKSVTDVSEEFGDIIGSKISGLRYFTNTLARLKFDNGFALLVGDCSSADCSEAETWFKIVSSKQPGIPELGTPITSIKLWGSIRHAEESTFYSEHMVVLNTDEGVYGLYSNNFKQKKTKVRMLHLEKEQVQGLHRSLDIHNAVFMHVEYSNDTIMWITIKCDEGVIYIVPGHVREMALFMTKSEIHAEEVMCISSWKKGVEKIKFLG